MKKKSHGGKRKNSGRPKEGTQQYVARLTIQQVKWLQSITDAGGHLQIALTRYMATQPATKRRAKRPERPRQRPIVPKDARMDAPYHFKPLPAPTEPKAGMSRLTYQHDGTTHYLIHPTTETPSFRPPTPTPAEVRASKQAAYQKTLTK